MTTDNQAAAQKQRVADAFSRIATTYDGLGPRYFTPFGRRLMAYAGIQPGVAVLDVGVGRGAVLFPAIAAAGPHGHVTGMDLASGMLAETEAEVRKSQIPRHLPLKVTAGGTGKEAPKKGRVVSSCSQL
ncbi:MAG: methyltransferase domain-containing protein [Dehalococcoidia bacterium]